MISSSPKGPTSEGCPPTKLSRTLSFVIRGISSPELRVDEIKLCLGCQENEVLSCLSGNVSPGVCIVYPSLNALVGLQECQLCKLVQGLVPEVCTPDFAKKSCNHGYTLKYEEQPWPGFSLFVNTSFKGKIILAPVRRSSIPSFQDDGPEPLPTINVKRIRQSIRLCETTHIRCKRHSSSLRQKSLVGRSKITLVDLRQQCLVQLNWAKARYVALSYIWGGVSQLQTTVANFKELKREKSLLNHQNEIPRVIKDAMELARNLGEQYLWV